MQVMVWMSNQYWVIIADKYFRRTLARSKSRFSLVEKLKAWRRKHKAKQIHVRIASDSRL